MGYWSLLLSLIFIIVAVFALRKLWLGALAAVILMIVIRINEADQLDATVFDLINGLLIAAELALLIVGAYLFYNILQSRSHFDPFTNAAGGFSSVLPSMLILVWFFGSFMEGIAGFGIPAMLIAPLMLSVGYKPLTSLALAVAGNTTPVTFGALGTPLKIGLGIHSPDDITSGVQLVNALPALCMPFLLTFVLGLTEGVKINWGKEWKMLLGAGLCFLIPYEIAGRYTVEFATVVAGALGLVLYIFIFIPKPERPRLRFWWKMFWPYLLLTVLLLVFRLVTDQFSWKPSAFVRAIKMYQPGLVFVLAAVFVLLIVNPKGIHSNLGYQFGKTMNALRKTIVTLVLLVCFAQLSRTDISGLSALLFERASDHALLVIAPVAGVTGSFISGSATMSNLLLFNGLREADFKVEDFRVLLTVLLHTGSAIGNAIAFQNIVMVKSVSDSDISVARIFRNNLVVVAVYLAIVILTGLVLYRRL